MERDLPFELYKHHRRFTKARWKWKGLVFENDLAFSIVYKRYIYARKCELCQKVFTKTNDRQMEHDHDTSKFRNVVCTSCNQLKADVKIQHNNTSGYRGICWHKGNDKRLWEFRAYIDGKKKSIKYMKDKDKLIAFATQWKIDNNYYT